MTDILALQGLDADEPTDQRNPPLSSLFSIVCCR
jgi:hypothetical protein